MDEFDRFGRNRADAVRIDPDDLVEIVGVGFDVRIAERRRRDVVDVDALAADPARFGRFDDRVVDGARIAAFPLQLYRPADHFAFVGDRGLGFGEGRALHRDRSERTFEPVFVHRRDFVKVEFTVFVDRVGEVGRFEFDVIGERTARRCGAVDVVMGQVGDRAFLPREGDRARQVVGRGDVFDLRRERFGDHFGRFAGLGDQLVVGHRLDAVVVHLAVFEVAVDVFGVEASGDRCDLVPFLVVGFLAFDLVTVDFSVGVRTPQQFGAAGHVADRLEKTYRRDHGEGFDHHRLASDRFAARGGKRRKTVLVMAAGFEVAVDEMGRVAAVNGGDAVQVRIFAAGGVTVDVVPYDPHVFDRFPFKSGRGDVGDVAVHRRYRKGRVDSDRFLGCGLGCAAAKQTQC